MKLRNLTLATTVILLPSPAYAQYFECEACPAGTWNNGNYESCQKCATGTYSTGGASSCTNCLTTGVASCSATTGKATSCKGGFGLLSSGACSQCSAGTYSPGGTIGCYSCSTGYWSSVGATKCTACTNKPSNSSYTSNSTSNSCSWSCNSGYIQSGFGFFQSDLQCCSTKTVYVYKKDRDCGFSSNPCSGYSGNALRSCVAQNGPGGGSGCGPEYYKKIGEISYTKSLEVESTSGLYYSTTNDTSKPTSLTTYSPSVNTYDISYGNSTKYSIKLNCSQ